MSIDIKNTKEIDLMKLSGKIAGTALYEAIKFIKVGVTEKEVDKVVEKTIYTLGGDLSYKTVPNFNFASCITVNEEVVHGVPTDRKIKEGDLVSVDLAVMYKGWHTDCAWTVLVGEADLNPEKQRFLSIGKEALKKGIKQAREGNRVGDISFAIQQEVESAGYSVVRALVGHGVGRNLHEEPEVPGYGKRNTGDILKTGMTLAIEVIYTMGGYDVELSGDGWTYVTVDRSLAGLFEMSVVVGKKEAKVLTDWRKV